jgi:hypothetical protein
MVQVPENLAPGSIASLLVVISPENLAFSFRASNSATLTVAFTSPEKSAF